MASKKAKDGRTGGEAKPSRVKTAPAVDAAKTTPAESCAESKEALETTVVNPRAALPPSEPAAALAASELTSTLPASDPTLAASEPTIAVNRPPSVFDPQSLVGTKIGAHYEIVCFLGKGGMSTVFKARDTRDDRSVALKFIHPHLLENEQIVRRFKHEALSLSALKHDHIAGIEECATASDGLPYIVMDFVEGKTLRDLLMESSRLHYSRSVPIFLQIASAMEHAHKQGVLHRDLKPGNIMLTARDGDLDFVKIVDFGLAKILPHAEVQASTLTNTGDVFGSPAYMSPEQCLGQKVDHRADIYALGCLMYEVLTGVLPLHGDSPGATLVLQIDTVPPPMMEAEREAKVPAVLEAIVFKAMSKEPNSRQQSMAQLEAELQDFLALQEAGIEYKPVSIAVRFDHAWKRNRKAMTWIISLAALFLLAAICMWWHWIHDWRDGISRLVCSLSVSFIVGWVIFQMSSLHRRMHELRLPVPIAELNWLNETKTDGTATDSMAHLEDMIESVERGDGVENRFNQERLRTTLIALSHGVDAEKLQYRCAHVVDLLEKRNQENSETALIFQEFLADAFVQAKNFERAESIYGQIASRWEETDAFATDVRCVVQLKLADALYFQRKFRAAEALYSAYVTRWEMLVMPRDQKYALRVSRLGDCYCGMDSFKLGELTYLKAMACWQSLQDKANGSLAFIKYVYTCWRRWKPIESERQFPLEVDNIEKGFGGQSPQAAAAMLLYAAQLWNRHDYVSALHWRRQADDKLKTEHTNLLLPKSS